MLLEVRMWLPLGNEISRDWEGFEEALLGGGNALCLIWVLVVLLVQSLCAQGVKTQNIGVWSKGRFIDREGANQEDGRASKLLKSTFQRYRVQVSFKASQGEVGRADFGKLELKQNSSDD